jgi:hypothetical protein
MRLEAPELPNENSALIYPPQLAKAVCALMPEHPLLASLGVTTLAQFLSEVFFASLQAEEGEHSPIRAMLTVSDASKASIAWPGQLRFRRPSLCSTRHLLRLARAASSERMFVTVEATSAGLHLTGLARERFGQDESGFIKIRALKAGCLEVWVSGERVLEYVWGHIQKPPEDVLLSTGPVHQKLLAFSTQTQAPAGYIEAVASIVRHLADHPHGGILVLSADNAPETPPLASFALTPDTHLWDLLHAIERFGPEEASLALERETIRFEIQRSIAEIGCMTSLDGATILDRRLGLCGFGIVLPVRHDVSVMEVVDAADTVRRVFPLDEYGARHRAAASYATSSRGSLVFVASVSGDVGCMLQDVASEHVLLWRFRSGDLVLPRA